MKETEYRQSRLCRLLGNPVVFSIVLSLAEHGELTPTEISKKVGRSVYRVSSLLGALRLAEVVRYDTAGRETKYRLKHPRHIRTILKSLQDFVEVAGPPHP